ncbi:hypothetical protein KR044_001341, partial [Drosophila immigrans]
LLPPRGGRQMSSEETYDQLRKNISPFAAGSVVEATMMHINIAENCIFVGKWGKESEPLKTLLGCEMSLVALQQLPDFGEIFAVYDDQGRVMTRVLINAPTESGGYDAYLLDYGEHIHLGGGEAIYGLPKDVAALPAEAIRCVFRNYDVAHLKPFLYQHVRLKILANNGKELQAEFLEEEQKTQSEVNAEQMATIKLTPPDDDHDQPTMQLSEAQMAMLDTTSFVSVPPKEFGSVVRIEVTYINSSTQIYVQFVDKSTPLVWPKKDIAESELKLRRAPRPLDMVLALYNDGFYYRAQVIDDDIDGMFKIFYVDYGNIEFVGINSLAHCNNARSLKPHRAVSCFMEGIKCNPLSSRGQSGECVEFLKSTILNAQFDVLLLSQMPDGYVIRLL